MTAIPYFGSGSSIEWPPAIDDPGLGGDLGAAGEDLGEHVGTELAERERDEVQRQDRRRPHRVDVGERVGGGDPAEVARVVDDRGEEVDGLDQRQVVAEPIDGRVVGGVEADQQVRVARRRQRLRAARAARRRRSCRRSRRRGRARSAAAARECDPQQSG